MIAVWAKRVFKHLSFALALVGLFALILAGMIAVPVSKPAPLAMISDTVRAADREGIPALSYFQARDGTQLGYRHYAARAPAAGRATVLIHGSSGSSLAMHPLAKALAARGVESFVPDIRGHGVSGTRGDIGYLGQLEDDLADLVAVVRKTAPNAALTLVGHSSGGGFALRAAGSPIQKLFDRTVLLAPYLGYDAPTTRPNSGGWANADIPRIIGLMALRGVGITCCEALPVLAFAVPPNSEKNLVATYSDRLMRNFAVNRDFRKDLANATRPITLISGADDELMFADKYLEAMRTAPSPVDVKLLKGINHMGIVSVPRAVSAIAGDIAKSGASS